MAQRNDHYRNWGMNTERMTGNNRRYSVRIRLPSEDDTVRLGQELAKSLALQAFRQHAFEGLVVRFLAKDLGTGIAAIQCMIQPASFVGSWWPWH